MYLSEIKVKGFRNLRDFTIALRPGLNVIVGENNSGKTNVLDALRAALGPAATATDPVRLDQNDLTRPLDNAPPTMGFSVKLLIEDMDADQRAQFIDALDFDPVNPHNSTATINFEWTWSDQKSRGTYRRWGREGQSDGSLPEDVLLSLPVYFLEALRDAERALSPGRQSRLGRLLGSLASDQQKQDLREIGTEANVKLQSNQLVKNAQDRIDDVLMLASGPSLSQDAVVRTSEPRFESIANSLRLVLKSRFLNAQGLSTEEEVDLNGLGYNNLLFVATTLAELGTWDATSLPILLVEEPEAHLHPQLQTLLADFLTRQSDKVQVLVTTHSPTIAAHVDPRAIRVLQLDNRSSTARSLIASPTALTDRALGHLQRMLDVTRATMLFARGVILVEGISEALIVPAVARLMGMNLQERAISVVPVSGVDFRTLASLFQGQDQTTRLAIITDGDPGVGYVDGAPDKSWLYERPAREADGSIKPSARTSQLVADFPDGLVRAFASQVTLEYDLAMAGPDNPELMAQAWESCFDQAPATGLNTQSTTILPNHEDRCLLIWRHICRSSTSRSKAEFAQALADLLSTNLSATGKSFAVPGYLAEAILQVCQD